MSRTLKELTHRFAFLQPAICLILALFSAAVCLRIELLNAEAGFYLPRRDFTESGNQKWRESMIVDEEAWIQFQRPSRNGEFDRSSLTPDERRQMQACIRREKANNELLHAVAGSGVAQYPIGAVAGLWSLYLLARQGRWSLRIMAGIALLLTLTSLGFAFYRSYFTSLGW